MMSYHKENIPKGVQLLSSCNTELGGYEVAGKNPTSLLSVGTGHTQPLPLCLLV